MKLRLTEHYSLALLFVLSILDLSSSSCPDVCEPCIEGHLYCVNVGLYEIPTVTEPGLRKVTIQKQRFLSTDLNSSNFSSYLGISQLSIRSSNINKVLPFTFSKLTSLLQLDLSDNAELIIQQNAFSGLTLQILKLDNMGIITLDLDAFEGLSVRSLSIQNSKLLTLPLKLIQPLSQSLLKLYLKNNLLRTLDPRLKSIFQSIEVFELQKNPFICNCSIHWLSEILQLSSSANPNSNVLSFENSEEFNPSCVSPPELRKKFLRDITKKLRNCSPPKIIRIDVSFESYSSATVDCFSDIDDRFVSNQMHVGWFPIAETGNNITQSQRSVKITQLSRNKMYLCRVANSNGNFEILFKIDWHLAPSKVNRTRVSVTKVKDNNTRDSILYRNVFSLFEMIFAIIGTLIITISIFIVFCCCHRCRIHIPFLETERKKHNFTTPPDIYERGVFIDDRRLFETEFDSRLFPPPPPTPPPFPSNRIIL